MQRVFVEVEYWQRRCNEASGWRRVEGRRAETCHEASSHTWTLGDAGISSLSLALQRSLWGYAKYSRRRTCPAASRIQTAENSGAQQKSCNPLLLIRDACYMADVCTNKLQVRVNLELFLRVHASLLHQRERLIFRPVEAPSLPSAIRYPCCCCAIRRPTQHPLRLLSWPGIRSASPLGVLRHTLEICKSTRDPGEREHSLTNRPVCTCVVRTPPACSGPCRMPPYR